MQLLPDGPLPLLAHQAVTNPPFNLLQGEFAPHSRGSDQWRAWRLAAMLGGCFIALTLLGKGVEIWRLKSTRKRWMPRSSRCFREAMPGEQNAIDARRRMEARLTQLHGSTTGQVTNLLAMMNVIAGAKAKVPETTFEAFSFRGTVLDMKIGARDVDSLDKLRRLVTDGGLQAELQSSNANDSGVEGRFDQGTGRLMSGLLDRIHAWLASLSEREHRLVTWGGAAAVVLLVLALLVLPLYSAANAAEKRVERKRTDLAWMQSVAGELRAAGPQMPPRNHWSLSWIKPPGLPDLLPGFAIHSRAALVVSGYGSSLRRST